MQIIPIKDIAAQSVQVTLGGQNCQIDLYTKTGMLYCDVYVNTVLLVGGVICQNLNRILRDRYFGFIGDLCFNDNAGVTDPISPGLGVRYEFWYLEASEV